MKKFAITQSKGFSLPLPNGYSVSVQFGIGNYCCHYDGREGKTPQSESIWQSYDAETAIIDPQGAFVRYKNDEVQGYQKPQDVFETIMYASKLK